MIDRTRPRTDHGDHAPPNSAGQAITPPITAITRMSDHGSPPLTEGGTGGATPQEGPT
jgi:hypothetical protein